jgi:hypothetical protein
MKMTNKRRIWIGAGIALAALSSIAASAADQTSYGRAGGAVGAGRIEQLATVRSNNEGQVADTSRWYGRAGGPIGAERVAGVNKAKTYAATKDQGKMPVVYGRAGVPLPFQQ